MAKNKKGATGAKASRQRAAKGLRNVPGVALRGSLFPDGPQEYSAFSMRDEARHTAYQHKSWDQVPNLRNKPVAFVSGGLVEPLKEPEASSPAMSPLQEPPVPTSSPGLDVHDGKATSTSHVAAPPLVTSVPIRKIPLSRPEPVDAKSTPNGHAEPSSFCFDLTGDKSIRREIAKVQVRKLEPVIEDEPSDSSEEVIVFKGRRRRAQKTDDFTLQEMQREIETVAHGIVQAPSLGDQKVEKNGASPEPREDTGIAPSLFDGNDSDAALDDYIANMLEDKDEDEDEDEDEDGKELLLQSTFGRRDLGGFQHEINLGDHDVHSKASDDSDTTDSSEHHEAEPAAELDDEQMARMLAKQEELGMGSDQLLLFNDFSAIPRNCSRRSKAGIVSDFNITKQAKSAKGPFPSATEVADAFEEYDLMNWSQAQQTKRNGKQLPNFDLSDSDMEANLRAAWQQDRLKKKEKKQAREELRAQGLLRNGVDPNDPRVKYQHGMGIEDIKAEFKSFLVGSENTMSLPPLDSNARKVIHDLANRLKIKSKSTGSGDQRRPVLHRTKYTAPFNEYDFACAIARIQRRYFPRLDRRDRGAKQTSGRPRTNFAAVNVREGEIVGGSAPEIGGTNRGRTMLEKMGWSTGMALGATDNKGITQPLEHIVKRSKAGLG